MLLNRFIVRNNKYNVHKKTISVVQNGFHAASQNPSIFQKSVVVVVVVFLMRLRIILCCHCDSGIMRCLDSDLEKTF